MTDEPLIQKLMSADDTMSRGAAEQAIRIVREILGREVVAKDAEIKRLRAALKPFSDACNEDLGRDEDDPNTDAWQSPYAMAVTIGDFENARVVWKRGDDEWRSSCGAREE